MPVTEDEYQHIEETEKIVDKAEGRTYVCNGGI